MFRLILTVASSIFSQEVRRHLADFCQGASNSDLVETKSWSESPNSQRTRNLIRSGHIRLTSGQTSDQNLISGNFVKTASWQKSAKKRRNY